MNLAIVTNKIRSASVALLFLVYLVTLTSAFNLPNRSPDLSSRLASLSMAAKPPHQRTMLTLAERVAYQRAIEEVYWRHRIWPKERPDPKPSLDEVMPPAQLEKKVEDYLRNSQALEDYWQRPITPDQLQAEMERIASHTKQPGVLREIFAALGNDPFVIAECLARPVLAERLITELYAYDQRFHGDLKRRAEADLRTHPTVKQMKQTSGMYTEMELVRSDSGDADSAATDGKNAGAIRLNGSQWQESMEKLAAAFGDGHPVAAGVPPAQPTRLPPQKPALVPGTPRQSEAATAQIKTGVLSPLQEDEGHYYAVAVTKKGKDRLKLATIAWLKEPLRSWVTRTETQVPVTMAAVSANYTLPVVASPSDACTDDSWTATSLNAAPAGRYAHTTVWTGSEMIVWGGVGSGSVLLNTGGRYNPSTNSWTATSTVNFQDARYAHTAVWTGSEMIIWGGFGGGNTGWRYNPGTDSWTATSTVNAPTARYDHTAVWTGSRMIVWGGTPDGQTPSNTGGAYNPSVNSWTATGTVNAPAARYLHTAVWTGSEMIVWGGHDGGNFYFNTGGRYNPDTGGWTATSTTNAPASRELHTAVWTGAEMIVWGGEFFDGVNFHYLNTGGRYNPSTDSWTATSATNVPAGRVGHTAVWTDSEMIIWGGTDNVDYFDTGGRYNPSTDSWTGTSLTNAPTVRGYHTAVWTDSEMIVWGGYNGSSSLNTGGRYCAQSQAPMAQSAFSRKTHGEAGTFDIPLPLTGNVGVECRSGGATNDYQMIINFATSVTVGSASVTSGTGSVSDFSVSGSVVTVNLTGVTNVQRITVTLFDVNDGTHMGNVPVSMGVLVGDVDGNAVVNASDVSLTKSQAGQPVTGSNFPADVNANGVINSTDVAQVKANVGTGLP